MFTTNKHRKQKEKWTGNVVAKTEEWGMGF
jgi:hypothetical protein